MNSLGKIKIEQAELTNDNELDLSSCRLNTIPEGLFKIPNLERLYLRGIKEGDQISDINRIKNYEGLSTLISIKELYLEYNFIKDVSFLRTLTNLQILNLYCNEIKDISALEDLTNLQVLNLRSNRIEDISALEKLSKIHTLDLSNNKIEDFSPLSKLPNLKRLTIIGRQLFDTRSLVKLSSLEELNLSFYSGLDFSFLAELTNLKRLDISHNSIENIDFLQDMASLKYLNLSYNRISDISFLKNIESLDRLHLDENDISDISPLIPFLKKGIEIGGVKGISLEGNRINQPPKFILEAGNKAIIRYFNDLENKKSIINNQTKLIFIGNSRAGKTSLWQFLKDKIYNEQADSTHGIKTEIWDTETLGTEDKQNLAAHIWDFGGQEYYHATHRLFLADNAVYVLVWEKDSNKQGTRLETFKLDDDPNGEIEEVNIEHFPASYWWESIQYFAGVHCPVLIVQNKVDSKSDFSPHTEGLSETADCFHLSIKNAFERFNLGKTDYAFEKFKETLLELLRKNATAFKLVKYYAQVREALEAKAKDTEYIAVSELKDIALQFDETPDLENLLLYLKSFTNTVLYFPQNDMLRDRLYLNPTHISRDIYKILNKTVRENNGKFDMTHIQKRLNCDVSESERFVALMKEFDLIFEKEEADKGQVFIAPQYLKEKDKLGVNIDMFSNQLKLKPAFYIHFAIFVPRSMMSRFIAHNGQFTTDETYWKNGLIYGSKETDASIKVEYTPETRTFCIDVQDIEQQAVDMQNIVAQFVKLNGNRDDKIELSNDGHAYFELRKIQEAHHQNRIEMNNIEGQYTPLNSFNWLIKKHKKRKSMTLEQLKEKVRNLISKAKTKEAMDEIAMWAHEQNQEQLKSDISLLKGDWADLSREKTLGLLSNSEATLRQNQLVNKVLNLVDSIESIDNELITVKPAAPVTNNSQNEDKPKIYFSYAWGDDHETGESREKLVGDLYESLKNDGFEVFRDKENSGYKDLLSDMMKDIGRGQFIVVAISDKYLKSPNCMFEMYEIYRNSKLEKDKFIEKIFPIRVESIRLSDPKVLDTYFEHWEQQEKEWADLITKRGTRISSAQQERYKRIKTIASELGDFLELLSDINTKTKEDLSHNNFEEIKNAIKTRIEKD